MKAFKKALCIAAIAASASAQAGTTVFEVESFLAGATNNTIATAQNLGSLISGSDLNIIGARNAMPGGSSVDYYAFTAASSLNFTFSVTTPTGDAYENDPIVGLFNSTGVKIGENDDTAFSYNSLLTQTLSAGTYYIAVTGYDNFAFTGDSGNSGWIYGLNIVATPVPEPESNAMLLAGLGLVGFMVRRRRC